MILTVEGSQEIHGQDVEWLTEVEVAYRPGVYSGPPERCYPDESEVDILGLETIPPGLEDSIDEDAVVKAAWEEYNRRAEEGP